MKTKQTYNGYLNYETWNVMLWLDRDQGAYNCYVAHARDLKRSRTHLGMFHARRIAEEALGDKTDDGVPLDSPKIRWGRIAEAMREACE